MCAGSLEPVFIRNVCAYACEDRFLVLYDRKMHTEAAGILIEILLKKQR